ncbi:MAG: TlpA disulfide reductase family protein [Flavobacteriaceae bacterium]|nr:TlpA disulfide reductase family protein [Flavobacteriaceae bacterium]
MKCKGVMKNVVLIFFLITCPLLLKAQTDKQLNTSRIELKSTEFKNNKYYLVGYYGKYTVLLDSVFASKDGAVIFKKDQKFTEGIYLLVDNEKRIVFEFLMDNQQQFLIDVNLADSSQSKVSNSSTNQDFFAFNSYLKNKYDLIRSLDSTFATQKTKEDSLAIQKKMSNIHQEITNYKDSYSKENPQSLISLLFNLSKPIDSYINEIKDSTLLNRNDSIAYVKNKFFENIDFSDPRLLRTPFLEGKIDTYFNSLVVNTEEQITKEIIKILDQTGSVDGELFSYLSIYFTNKYIDPKIMGLDKVYVNLYNHYFLNKEYSWLTLQQKTSLKSTCDIFKGNQLGSKARNLFMNTLQDTRIDLYDVKSPYMVLLFWDPNCGHCKTEIPKIKVLYDEVWKTKGIKVFAVNINADMNDEWKEILEKEKLHDWINVYPAKTVVGNYTQEDVNFQLLYNVYQTPVIYLLDVNKKIIAKKIGFERFMEIINLQSKID